MVESSDHMRKKKGRKTNNQSTGVMMFLVAEAEIAHLGGKL